MFGLSLEKLLVLAVIAAFVLGPQRLPLYAHRLAELVRGFRAFLASAEARATAELGDDWRRLDPRQYDPRAIVRDALAPDPAAARPVGTEATALRPAAPEPAARPRYDSRGRAIRSPA